MLAAKPTHHWGTHQKWSLIYKNYFATLHRSFERPSETQVFLAPSEEKLLLDRCHDSVKRRCEDNTSGNSFRKVCVHRKMHQDETWILHYQLTLQYTKNPLSQCTLYIKVMSLLRFSLYIIYAHLLSIQLFILGGVLSFSYVETCFQVRVKRQFNTLTMRMWKGFWSWTFTTCSKWL